MVVGVRKEVHHHEHRVGLTPFAVARLIQQGHAVVVERDAGTAAHFEDRHYEDAGARIVYSADEVYRRAEIVCQIGPLTPRELEMLRPESVIASFHHLAVRPREVIERLMELQVTLVGYELIEDAHGNRPVLHTFSEMAGQLAIHVAAHLLQTEAGGRGVLLGNVPGVPPPTVVILGAGAGGRSAARQALASGAHVIVLDADVRQLQAIHHEFIGRLVTAVASKRRLEQYTAIADVLVGAVLVPGARSPYVVDEDMVRSMKPGSVIVDLSIDQGGCVETSRPTTPHDPTFVVHGVLHYCVPNMTANIPRTASRALANTALPYVIRMAGQGVRRSLREDPGLAAGVYLYGGRMVQQGVGEALGIEVARLSDLIEGDPTP